MKYIWKFKKNSGNIINTLGDNPDILVMQSVFKTVGVYKQDFHNSKCSLKNQLQGISIYVFSKPYSTIATNQTHATTIIERFSESCDSKPHCLSDFNLFPAWKNCYVRWDENGPCIPYMVSSGKGMYSI